MSEVPKINVSPLLGPALATGCKGARVISQTLCKLKVGDFASKIQEHPLAKKVVDHREIALEALSVALIFHGAHFRNQFLCFQVVTLFFLERVATKVKASWSDITVAQEKLEADSSEDKNKKSDAAADIAVARKALKTLDSQKLTAASVEVLIAIMSCLLVMHGGLAQKVAVTYFTVTLLAEKLDTVLVFPDHEDIQAWTHVLSRFLLWLLLLPTAVLFGPLVLCINASVRGALLLAEKKEGGMQRAGIAPDSQKGHLVTCALAGVGTLYQLWSCLAGGGLAWYLQLVYFPAVLVECILSAL